MYSAEDIPFRARRIRVSNREWFYASRLLSFFSMVDPLFRVKNVKTVQGLGGWGYMAKIKGAYLGVPIMRTRVF